MSSDADASTTYGERGPELPPGLLAKLRIDVPGYQLLDELGSGGQAIVYRARELTSGLTVAVKILHAGPHADQATRERFRRETAALNALNHPNIVCVVESGQTPAGLDYLVMNFVDGHPLDVLWKDRRLAAKIAPEPPARLRLIKHICDIVQAAHRAGITHRDLSPSNIILDDRGEPHVLDFGLAATAFDAQMNPGGGNVTVTGQFIGKLKYASPEQARGMRGGIDIRTDVYALGVILYQTLTNGAFPYEVVGNLVDVLNNIIHSKPMPPSAVLAAREAPTVAVSSKKASSFQSGPPLINETIEAIVLKALEKDPADRYESAGALGEDIERYLAGTPTVARLKSKPAAETAEPTRRIWPRVLTAAGVFALIAVVAVGAGRILLSHGEPSKATTALEPIAASSPSPQTVVNSSIPPSTLVPAAVTSQPAAPALAPIADSAAPSVDPRASSAAAQPPTDGHVDLIQLFDPTKDAVAGTWTKADGEILGEESARCSRIEFRYAPPAEYDYQVRFVRVTGNSPIQMICRGGNDRGFLFGIGESETNCGFGRIDGKNANFNVTTRHGDPWIVNGQPCTALVKVRRNSIEGYLDGTLITSYTTDFGDMTLASELGLHDESAVGFDVYNHSQVRVLSADVTEITGKGQLLRRDDQSPTPAVSQGNAPAWPNAGAMSPTDAVARNAPARTGANVASSQQPANAAARAPQSPRRIDLMKLVDVSKDSSYGTWTRDAVGLHASGVAATMQFPYSPPAEYDYRIVFSFEQKQAIRMICFSKRQFMWAFDGKGGMEFPMNDIANPTNRSLVPCTITPLVDHECIVRVRSSHVEAVLDGKLVSGLDTNYANLAIASSFPRHTVSPTTIGLDCLRSTMVVKSADVVEVTGSGTLLR